MDERLQEAHAALKRRGCGFVLGGIVLWFVVAAPTVPTSARYFCGIVAAWAVFHGGAQFARVSNERRRARERANREADWMSGRKRLERAVTEQPGMTLADVEALLAEARREGATDETVVHATSFFKGEGVRRLWIDVDRYPRTPSDSQ